MSEIKPSDVSFYVILSAICGLCFGIWQGNFFAGLFMGFAAFLAVCIAEVSAG